MPSLGARANSRTSESTKRRWECSFSTFPRRRWSGWPADEMARHVRQGEPEEVGIPHGVGYLWTDGVRDVFTAFVRGAAGSALKVEVSRAMLGVDWPLPFAEHALTLFAAVHWPQEAPQDG